MRLLQLTKEAGRSATLTFVVKGGKTRAKLEVDVDSEPPPSSSSTPAPAPRPRRRRRRQVRGAPQPGAPSGSPPPSPREGEAGGSPRPPPSATSEAPSCCTRWTPGSPPGWQASSNALICQPQHGWTSSFLAPQAPTSSSSSSADRVNPEASALV